MTSKALSVSIIGGKNRSGFEKLPDSDVVAAARKSRSEKNRVCLKIGAVVVVTISALVACLLAFLVRTSDFVSVQHKKQRSSEMRDNIEHRAEVESVSRAAEEFSKSLYGVVKETEEGNILFSPYSVAAVLAMLSEGARGKTLDMMRRTMHLPKAETLRAGYKDSIPALRTNENFTLDTANTAFVMKEFQVLEEFKTSLHENYHADMSSVDFADNEKAARTINDWVKSETRDKIKDLIPADSLSALTRLVLVNAVYFKADWETQFDKENTDQDQFWVTEEESKEVPMMSLTGQKMNFASLNQLDCSMIELPYKGNRIVMQVILPKEKTGVFDLEKKLGEVDLQSLFSEKKKNVKVDLSLPKFKLSHSLALSDSLQQMGMEDMFSAGKADLSGITGSRDLFVSSVVQKVFVEVNEEGSEAAAATGVMVMMRSMPAPNQMFNVDHPFIFIIRDKLTGMILFQGRVVDPSA